MTTERKKVPGVRYAPEVSQSVQERLDADSAGFLNTVGRSFVSGGNFAYTAYKRIGREIAAGPADANYDPSVDIEKYNDRIPGNLQARFKAARNADEFQMMLADMDDELSHQRIIGMRSDGSPISTFVAEGLAGVLDIDAPVSMATAGSIKAATTAGRLLKGASIGAATQTTTTSIGHYSGITGHWSDIVVNGLAGAGFGALIGNYGYNLRTNLTNEAKAYMSKRKAQKEFAEAQENNFPLATTSPEEVIDTPFRDPASYKMEDITVDADDPSVAPAGKSSAGAAAQRDADLEDPFEDISNRTSKDFIEEADEWAGETQIPTDYATGESNLLYKKGGDYATRAANRITQVANTLGIATDFDKLFRTPGNVSKKLAYDIFENASGIVRNNRSAGALQDLYSKRLAGVVVPQYNDAFSAWARDKGASRVSEAFSTSLRAQFDRDLRMELAARFYDDVDRLTNNPHIKDAADAVDRWSAEDVKVGKGRDGETSIFGYEDLQAKSGYFAQSWSGRQMTTMINSKKFTRKQIEMSIAENYQALHGIPRTDAMVFAKAVTRRAINNDKDVNANLIGLLQDDGKEALLGYLKDSGVDAQDAERMVAGLVGAQAERGRLGQTKQRIDIDPRFTSSDGIQIIDLLDNNIQRQLQSRIRGTAGRAALARKGITNKQDRDAIIQAIMDEQHALGEGGITRKELEDLFSYFEGGPIAGGLNPITSRIKKLTNLALLNQLGLTQVAETGVQIAAVGFNRWWKHAAPELKTAMKNPESELVQELRHLGIMEPEERLFRDDIPVDEELFNTAQAQWLSKLDHTLNAGRRVQGALSGFYMVRRMQQRIAVSSAADKIMSGMKFGNGFSADRLADMGIDASMAAKLQKKVDDGIIEFEDGSVKRFNFDKWSPLDAENFALALNRHSAQVVQRALIGEDTISVHSNDFMALLLHLKSFPLLAMQKQTYRHLRNADMAAVQAFMYAMATAGIAYTAKQVVNGRDIPDAEDIMKGAFGLNNLTGWIPMWTDPIAAMLGMDDLRFNTYTRGIDQNVVSTPAALPTMNRMMQIPGAVINTLSGNMDNNDIRALQATPIIGNLYGFSALFNAMKN